MKHEQLIYEFFKLFSRFEYALKIVGFLNKKRNAEANWKSFANSIEDDFAKEKNERISKSVKYILDYPPKKQIVKDGVLQWSKDLPKNIPELDLLLILVRRVRNNLFHGGKYGSRYLKEPDRSKQLILACISILEHCLKLSHEVNEAFEFNLE